MSGPILKKCQNKQVSIYSFREDKLPRAVKQAGDMIGAVLLINSSRKRTDIFFGLTMKANCFSKIITA